MPDILLLVGIVVGSAVYFIAAATGDFKNLKTDLIAMVILSIGIHWFCAYIYTPITYSDIKTCKVYTIPGHSIQYIYYKNEIINLSERLESVVIEDDFVVAKTPNKLYYGIAHIMKKEPSTKIDVVIEGHE